jgi:hypothetical protein
LGGFPITLSCTAVEVPIRTSFPFSLEEGMIFLSPVSFSSSGSSSGRGFSGIALSLK